MTNFIFEPGDLVKMASNYEWGVGQVQSSLDKKVTVNFEHKGKVVLNISRVDLILISSDE